MQNTNTEITEIDNILTELNITLAPLEDEIVIEEEIVATTSARSDEDMISAYLANNPVTIIS